MAFRCDWINRIKARKRSFAAAVAVAAGLCVPMQATAQQEDLVARQAIISALVGDDDALRQSYALAQQRRAPSGGIGTAEAIYYLYNCTRDSREEFLAGQEILAANARDKDWRNRVLLSLLSDEVYELNKLEGQNRFNKFSRVFNRVSTSLSQLVLLQPQAAASLLWDGIYSFRGDKPATVKERKMVYLCDQFLRKYPNAPERNEVVALRQELKQKMIADRAKALTQAGQSAMTEGQFHVAEWHLEKAALLRPADAETSQLLAQARTLKIRKDEVRGLTLGVSSYESRLPEAQAAAIGTMARALIKGDVESLTDVRQNVPGMWDSVDYAYAAISERRGNHAEALNRLNSLAGSAPATPGGKAATKLLDNPNYNLNDSYQKALAEMASEKSKFIWTGRRTKDDTVYAAGSAAIQNAANPVAVPMLFGMDAAVRAISEKFRTQVSVDGVIDAGARYLRKYPETPRSQEIARQLATLSKKAGDYEGSLEYLNEGGGGSPEEIAKLKENQAKALFEQAKSSADLLEKRRLLSQLLKEFPDTKIARNSGAKEQEKLPPALADDTLVLPAEALKRDPKLAQYLGVAAHFVDGSKGNGEVTDEGIAITASADSVEFRLRGETQWRRAPLMRDYRDWIMTAAQQLRQEYMSITEARDQQYRQKLPFAVEGGVGSAVDIAPKILPHPTSQQDKDRFQ